MAWKKWKGEEIKRRMREEAGKALLRAGKATVSEIHKVVPLDEGTLESTVDAIQNPNNQLEVCVTAGGGPGTGFARVPYAIKWHEVPADFQGEGRGNNYVRNPFKTFTPGAVEKELKKAVKKVLK